MKIKNDISTTKTQHQLDSQGIAGLRFPLKAAELFEELVANAELKENLIDMALALAGKRFSPHEIYTDGLSRLMTMNARSCGPGQGGVTFQDMTHLQRVCYQVMSWARLDLIRKQHRSQPQTQDEIIDQAMEDFAIKEWQCAETLKTTRDSAREQLEKLIAQLPAKSKEIVTCLADGGDRLLKRTGTVHQERLATELNVNQSTISRRLDALKEQARTLLAEEVAPHPSL